MPQDILLLYDCDTNKENKDMGRLRKRLIPLQSKNPIKKGIENLFKKSIVDRSIKSKPDFIDTVEAHSKTERGSTVRIPKTYHINENEKTNLCTWICENGKSNDFKSFKAVFDHIESFLDDISIKATGDKIGK